MTIRYGWLIENQVILTQMEGLISPAEFRQWADKLNPFYNQIPFSRLHIIIDGTGLQKIPSIKEMLNIPVHEKRGWILIVGLSDRLLQFLTSMVVQLTHTELKFVTTVEEAVEVLQRVDLTLQSFTSAGEIAWVTIAASIP